MIVANVSAPDPVLCLNAGSSSLKFALFLPEDGLDDGGLPRPRLSGTIEAPGGKTKIRIELAERESRDLESSIPFGNTREELEWLLGFLSREGLPRPGIVAHRIVHGGRRHERAVRVDAAVLTELESLVPLAPLHQPPGLALLTHACEALPEALAVACFDTAFHATRPELETRYPLPRSWYERGYLRYGFHGLSYESVARRLTRLLGERARGRIVVAHLGSGASLCGLRELRSVTTTMGLTALDGLVMATRPGSLDPGLVLHWFQNDGLTAHEIEDLLYHQSGLLGLSETSGDVRELVDDPDPRARLALAMYVESIVRHTGSIAAALGGLEGFVFTGGVGFHQPAIRASVVARLSWLGFGLDAQANDEGRTIVSPPNHPPVLILQAREEAVMALAAWEVVAKG